MMPAVLVFVGMGIYSFKRKTPMYFWAGTTVKSEEISDIKAYNRANGIMWVSYGLSFLLIPLLGSMVGSIVIAILSPFIIVGMVLCYDVFIINIRLNRLKIKDEELKQKGKIMGYIKSYTNLSNIEKNEVYKFIKVKENSVDSLEELDDKFNIKIYEYGEGALFYFEGNKVEASICVVLEVAKILKSAYIHQIKCAKDIKDKVDIIRKLVEESVNISKTKGATDIRLGINKQEISDEEINKLNFKIEYNSFEMVLKDRCKRNKLLKLKILNEENKLRYIDIYNDSFSDMPHGTVTNIDTVNKNIEKSKNDNNRYFIVLDEEDNEIGFIEIIIENDKGLFDIGLCKKYRGKGYGKRILETAIQFLAERQVKEIALIVIEQNKIAYEMYKKRGFEVSQIMGGWVIL